MTGVYIALAVVGCCCLALAWMAFASARVASRSNRRRGGGR